MPAPTDPTKAKYMFSDDVKFLQKVVVFHPQNKDLFLAIKRASHHVVRPNLWDFPGGNVSFGEKYDDSLLREVYEETGIHLQNIRPYTIETNFVENIYYLFIGYTAYANTDVVVLSSEHTEFKWVTQQEFFQLESAGFVQKMITDMK